MIGVDASRPTTGAPIRGMAPELQQQQQQQQHSRPYTAGDNIIKPSVDKYKDMGKFVYVEEYLKSRPPSGTVNRRTDVNVEDYVKNRPPSGHAPRGKSMQTNVHMQNANATFNSFIDDGGPHGDLSQAYNKVTGVLPANYNSASQGSKQFQILQQQRALKQQSKNMLEQSKAKHQAMVAQAYAMQKSLKQDLDLPSRKQVPQKSHEFDPSGYNRYSTNKITPQQQRQMDVDIENAVHKYAPRPPSQPSNSRKAGMPRPQRLVLIEFCTS